MKKIIKFLMSNTITYGILSLLTYALYGSIIGICLAPSGIFVYKLWKLVGLDSIYDVMILTIGIGISIYIFFVISLLIFGILERILVIGFKPGRYSVDSGVFARWLIYSGLHIILLNLVLPFMAGTPWSKMFYKILGCKMGKNVFINTRGLHDAYLLEVGDNVVVGGNTDISCHIFEGRELILGKIKIGSNTLIGTGCYIMPDVMIGENCNIGVYSYIRKKRNIPAHSMIMAIPGMPAKKVAEIVREEREVKAGVHD